MRAKRFFKQMTTVAVGLTVVALVGTASPRAVQAQPSAQLFFDNMEAGVNGWTTDVEILGPGDDCSATTEWHQVTNNSHSPTHSWTNTPYAAAGTNGDNCIHHLISPAFATPLGDPSIFLSFWEHHFSEGGMACNPPTFMPPCDFGQVWISKNGGAFINAQDPGIRYEGGAAGDPYVQHSIGLGGLFTPGDSIRIRFTFSSDALLAIPMGGWWIDDVAVNTDNPPTAAMLASFSAKAGGKNVHLSWRTASELDVLGFNVWRYGAGKTGQVNRSMVTAKALARAGGAAYRLVDRNLEPGAAYTYRLEVVRQDGSRAWYASRKVRVQR